MKENEHGTLININADIVLQEGNYSSHFQIKHLLNKLQRSISVLQFLARLFEKLIYNKLYDYLDVNKLLFSGQSGFRTLHSTVIYLLFGTNDWYITIEKGKYTANIFADLKKAFDTVNNSLLIEKLSKYGIPGLELQWFKSYLSNRYQVIKVNVVESKSGKNHIGCSTRILLRTTILSYLY